MANRGLIKNFGPSSPIAIGKIAILEICLKTSFTLSPFSKAMNPNTAIETAEIHK